MRLFSLLAVVLACSAWEAEPKSLLADFVSGGAVVFSVTLALVVFRNHWRT